MRWHQQELLEAGTEEIAMIDEESERREIEALLPWYAEGTLSCREADLVEGALARDSELVRRYAVVRQELTETAQLNETLGAPSARAMEKLFAPIDAEEAAAPRKRLRRTNRTPSLATASTMNDDAPGGSRVRVVKVREARWEFSGKAQDHSPRSWCYPSSSLRSASASSLASSSRSIGNRPVVPATASNNDREASPSSRNSNAP